MPYLPAQTDQLGLTTAAGMRQVQPGVCSVPVTSVATRIAANCTELLSVICGSGDCMSKSFPYFIFPHDFILYFFLEKICDRLLWKGA